VIDEPITPAISESIIINYHQLSIDVSVHHFIHQSHHCFPYQWIGLRENLQESPMILMGK
jgi:hypothetical protein